ncbi:MAG TPA: FAD-dependent monooxygenase [Caldimonas sp.]|jgi:2-polyprenyl-6-methoxyphenol hydroxylase-like FAD-dependent oxidoreductase|nr:FAD-dependent monooxygenase [Caldimonas sp.]HEX2540824.1 FAD-dependent monooxygenase [Caldimonas sp.]
MPSFDVQVNGAGIVGRSLALSLARLGLSVALRSAAPRQGARGDVRAFALNDAAVALLRSLKVWEALPADSVTPVHDMRVQGDAGAAALEFSAWEQRVGALAYITDAAALEQELDAAIRFAAHVTRVESDVPAALIAHCEGRAAAGMAGLDAGHETFDYAQTAIAARLVAERPHRHVARQWFRSPDVLALLPFDRPQARRSYALVWSLPTARAEELLAATPASFESELAAASGGEVGPLALASERSAWPLLRSRASHPCGPGWVLVGDAAHVVHPLAGQGLNLGLADVAALAGVIARREPWRALGDERLLRRYVRQRAGPTAAMLRITDGLQGLFADPDSPLRELRNNGMSLVNRVSPLKRWLAARALDT